jgi:hypothetical protein
MNLKQIVLDKDALLGIGFQTLCDFARDHILIVWRYNRKLWMEMS